MTVGTAADVAAALRDADAVTILCHVRPDPDTLGSGLGLGLALSELGTTVEVAYPGTLPLPASMVGLPGSEPEWQRLAEALRGWLQTAVTPAKAGVQN